MAAPILISLPEAVATIQPHLGDLSASHWLGDLRRSAKRYSRRVKRPPVWCRLAGRVFYPVEEIKRVVAELSVAAKKS